MTGTWLEDPTDKVAIVTGGAGGIGHALAAQFLEAGMRVVIADVDVAVTSANRDVGRR